VTTQPPRSGTSIVKRGWKSSRWTTSGVEKVVEFPTRSRRRSPSIAASNEK
jgi:hypothetical protein